VGGLANGHVRAVLLTLPRARASVCVCVRARACVCVRACVCARARMRIQIILFHYVPEIMAHIVCVDRMRRVRAVRKNLQRTHCCCGASAKLMGMLGSTFRTSQV
jgi:hypothetical protein